MALIRPQARVYKSILSIPGTMATAKAAICVSNSVGIQTGFLTSLSLSRLVLPVHTRVLKSLVPKN
jgi:hypothetical protein